MKSLAERRQASALIGAEVYTVAKHRDTLLLREVLERLPAGGVFLDAGCGRNFYLASRVRPHCRVAIGADLDPMAVREHGLPGVQSDLAALAIGDGSVDVLATRSVVEHLSDPLKAFREFARVLKPGGAAVMLFPNKWYYACAAGRLVPGFAAGTILKLIYGKSVYDNFPTYYRANTRGAMRSLAREAGLEVRKTIVTEHPPHYLKLSPFLFRLGVWFDQATVRHRLLHGLATSYIVVLEKPGESARTGRARGA